MLRHAVGHSCPQYPAASCRPSARRGPPSTALAGGKTVGVMVHAGWEWRPLVRIPSHLAGGDRRLRHQGSLHLLSASNPHGVQAIYFPMVPQVGLCRGSLATGVLHGQPQLLTLGAV